MAITHETKIQIQEEGIDNVEKIVNFNKDTLKQVADNLRRPAGRVTETNPGATRGATISTPQLVFGAKSQMHLLISWNLSRYYNRMGKYDTPVSIWWDPFYTNFLDQWAAIINHKKGDNTKVLNISKTLIVIKWI